MRQDLSLRPHVAPRSLSPRDQALGAVGYGDSGPHQAQQHGHIAKGASKHEMMRLRGFHQTKTQKQPHGRQAASCEARVPAFSTGAGLPEVSGGVGIMGIEAAVAMVRSPRCDFRIGANHELAWTSATTAGHARGKTRSTRHAQKGAFEVGHDLLSIAVPLPIDRVWVEERAR